MFMKNFIKKLYPIILFKLIKKRRYYHTDFKCWISKKKYRIIHPLWFILLIIYLISWILNEWIIETIKETKQNFCII